MLSITRLCLFVPSSLTESVNHVISIVIIIYLSFVYMNLSVLLLEINHGIIIKVADVNNRYLSR